KLHGNEEQTLFRLTEVDQTNRVGMIEARGGARLVVEPLDPRWIGRDVRAEDLDGDDAVDRQLLGSVDDSGSAFADALEDLEAIGEHLAKQWIVALHLIVPA